MLDISVHDASSLPLALRAPLSGFYVTQGATMADATTGRVYSQVIAIACYLDSPIVIASGKGMTSPCVGFACVWKIA